MARQLADPSIPHRRTVLLGSGAVALSGLWLPEASAAPAEPAPKRPVYRRKLSDDEITQLFTHAAEEVKATTAAHIGTWHMDSAQWAVDLEAGAITFKTRKGWTVSAPVQVVGTRLTTDGSWLWAWDNPSIPPARAADALRVRAFGARQGIDALTLPKIPASEADAWKYTALAAHLAAANGAYRGTAGKTEVFMTFGKITIAGD